VDKSKKTHAKVQAYADTNGIAPEAMNNNECADAHGDKAPNGAKRVRQGSVWVHPTGGAPERVDVVALGYSMRSYVHRQLTKGLDPDEVVDEVWTVNRGLRVFEADMAFVLDELPDEIANDPHYGDAIMGYQKPIISTTCDPRAVWCRTYPAADILDCLRIEYGIELRDPYWHNSMPMIMAYALYIGVKELTLWGCDYTSEGGLSLEDDRANLEYWIGMCRALGMRVGVPTDTTLLNQRKHSGGLYVYGLRDQRNARAFLDTHMAPAESERERIARMAEERAVAAGLYE